VPHPHPQRVTGLEQKSVSALGVSSLRQLKLKPGDAQYDPASYRRPPRMLSLMVSGGSFHKSIRASGGSKPRDASATNPPVDLTPATMPTTAAKSTHTTAIARFICLSLMIPTVQ
jgi:hypothetical protein